MSAEYWAARYVAEAKARETAERNCKAIQAKADKQRQEIGRLTREVEQLKADKAALRFDIAKAKAGERLAREAAAEALGGGLQAQVAIPECGIADKGETALRWQK